MRVGFLSNQLDNRGTGNALFDYAYYNRELLGNESKIYTFAQANHNPLAVRRFENEFGYVEYIRSGLDIHDIDVLYHIKYGTDDGFRIDPSIRYAVHAVFEVRVHGDRYAAVSHWLANREVKTSHVPHIVFPISSRKKLDNKLGISYYDFVIGRHGGFDSFDIPWVWDAISESLDRHPGLHFVFMNTQEQAQHPRIHYLPEGGPLEKRALLNSCDAMLHARVRGETFGLAVGEFAYYGLPVMTYAESPEKAHIEELGEEALLYRSVEDIVQHIDQLLDGTVGWPRYAYDKFEPKDVMPIFKEVFLD